MIDGKTITIEAVTSEQVAKLETKLREDKKTTLSTFGQGITQIEGHGIVAQYQLQGSVLTVMVVSKPWLLTMSAIHNQIVEALGK